MQIPSLPPPLVTNALAQDVTAKIIPNAQAAVIMANAVAPPPKSEKSNQSRNNKERNSERRKNGDRGKKGDRGDSVNISV